LFLLSASCTTTEVDTCVVPQQEKMPLFYNGRDLSLYHRARNLAYVNMPHPEQQVVFPMHLDQADEYRMEFFPGMGQAGMTLYLWQTFGEPTKAKIFFDQAPLAPGQVVTEWREENGLAMLDISLQSLIDPDALEEGWLTKTVEVPNLDGVTSPGLFIMVAISPDQKTVLSYLGDFR
jgi:hypothetical protein